MNRLNVSWTNPNNGSKKSQTATEIYNETKCSLNILGKEFIVWHLLQAQPDKVKPMKPNIATLLWLLFSLEYLSLNCFYWFWVCAIYVYKGSFPKLSTDLFRMCTTIQTNFSTYLDIILECFTNLSVITSITPWHHKDAISSPENIKGYFKLKYMHI